MRLNWAMALLCLCQFNHIHPVNGEDFTIVIHPGREECFYIQAAENQSFAVDYVVLSTTHGALDINFQLIEPEGRPLVTDFQKSESTHVIKVHTHGVYSICFDNTFSHISRKQVSFTVELDRDKNIATWHKYNKNNLAPEGEYGLKVKDIEDSMDRVRLFVNNIKEHQEHYRMLEIRDRSTAESNFERVNFWSTITIFVILVVGAVQVVLVKSLFDNK